MPVFFFLDLGKEIEGTATEKNHKNQVELMSWQLSESNSASWAHGGAGTVSFGDIPMSKKLDKASAKIFQYCAASKKIPQATLSCLRAAGNESPSEYLNIKLTDCFVTSYSTGGSSGDDVPIESFTLNFAKIEILSKAPDGATQGTASYDLRQVVASAGH